MKNLFFLCVCVAITSFIVSCNDELTELPDFPRKYVIDSFSAGKVIALTNYNKVLFGDDLERFVSPSGGVLWNEKEGSYLNDYYRKLYDFEIEILSDSSGRILADKDTFQCDIIRSDGVLYFQSLYVRIEGMAYTNKVFRPYYTDPQFLYAPLNITESPRTSGIGTVYYPCIYMVEAGSKLIMPMLTYRQVIYDDYTITGYGIVNANNVFNTTYLEKLNTKEHVDTLVYQNNKIIFRLE